MRQSQATNKTEPMTENVIKVEGVRLSDGNVAPNSSPSTAPNRSSQGNNMYKQKSKDNLQAPQVAKPKVGGMFADASQMNADAISNIAEPDYDVSIYYHETGVARTIATNTYFENLTLTVICFNAIWIGYDTDENNDQNIADAELQFQIGEYAFFAYFTFEWAVRFCAFAKKLYCLYDNWFKFDSALVLQMWVDAVVIPMAVGSTTDSGSLNILKLLRLLRLARMVRLMRAVPEMITMMKGIVAATRSVGTTLSLLIMFTYVFAIVFAQQLKGTDLHQHFGTIPKAIWTLLLAGTFMDNLTNICTYLYDKSPLFLFPLFLMYVLISAMTFLNMLIGVLCEVVSSVAESEKEKATITFVKENLVTVLNKIDEDNSGQISREEFQYFLTIPEAEIALTELGVDGKHLMMLEDVMFEDSAEKAGAETAGLSIGELCERIVRLRSTNSATVTDIVDLQKYIFKTLKANQTVADAELRKLKNEVKEEVATIREDVACSQKEVRLQLVELNEKLDFLCNTKRHKPKPAKLALQPT